MTEEQRQEYRLKREVVLETLESLFNHWDLARHIYNVAKSTNLTKTMVDELIDLIETSFKNMNDEKLIGIMHESMGNLEKKLEQKKIEMASEEQNADFTITNLII